MAKPRKTIGERLIKRLRDELSLELPTDCRIQRMYPGHWQRSAGAFSWIIESTSPKSLAIAGRFVGSQERVRDLLRAKTLVMDHCFGDYAICSGDDD